jgi:hypothetical protein
MHGLFDTDPENETGVQSNDPLKTIDNLQTPISVQI